MHGASDAYHHGLVAEWSCSGLQIRVRRFDSDPSLHSHRATRCRWPKNPQRCGFFCACDPRKEHRRLPAMARPSRHDGARSARTDATIASCAARMAKSVAARDLKSLDRKVIPVRVRVRAPLECARNACRGSMPAVQRNPESSSPLERESLLPWCDRNRCSVFPLAVAGITNGSRPCAPQRLREPFAGACASSRRRIASFLPIVRSAAIAATWFARGTVLPCSQL